mmetsp:Transcript_60993/g.114813  ORF Transcript_60993/g.114813 Transcript_60993/m.114813 type:complete len:210 (+) Transcript_60993:369-998(+)
MKRRKRRGAWAKVPRPTTTMRTKQGAALVPPPRFRCRGALLPLCTRGPSILSPWPRLCAGFAPDLCVAFFAPLPPPPPPPTRWSSRPPLLDNNKAPTPTTTPPTAMAARAADSINNNNPVKCQEQQQQQHQQRQGTCSWALRLQWLRCAGPGLSPRTNSGPAPPAVGQSSSFSSPTACQTERLSVAALRKHFRRCCRKVFHGNMRGWSL